MKKNKVAIIGCGKQAPKHITGLKNIPGVEVVLADINVEYARKLAEQEGLEFYQSVDEVFLDETVDAVDICTPTQSHAQLIKSAINTNKDFLCEKPLTESLAEGKELAELIKTKNIIGMVGYIYRFAPVFEQGKKVLEGAASDGESLVLGNISSASFRLGGRGSHQLWKHKVESGGGAINEMLVHMVDLAIWYFGRVKSVETYSCELRREKRLISGVEHDVDAEDYVIIEMLMECGTKVLCQADLITPAFTQFTEIQGDNGTFVGSIQADMPNYIFCSQEVSGYLAGKSDFKYGALNLFEAQMGEFINAIRNRKEPSRSTLLDSVILMEAMEMIDRKIK